jgi:hypothetical protein
MCDCFLLLRRHLALSVSNAQYQLEALSQSP